MKIDILDEDGIEVIGGLFGPMDKELTEQILEDLLDRYDMVSASEEVIIIKKRKVDVCKCDSCNWKGYHTAGSFVSVAEGGDDPYGYEFCGKEHWHGGPPPEKGKPDPWKDCKDYLQIEVRK